MATRRRKSNWADKFSAAQKTIAAAAMLVILGSSGTLFFFNTFETKEAAEKHYEEFDTFKQKYWSNRKEDRENRRMIK